MASVFISYRRQPSAMLATLLARELRERHIEVYLDTQRMDSAGPFPDRLKDGIRTSDVFICLVGAGTFESDWVREEISTALEAGKPLIPVFQESYQQGAPIPTPAIKRLLEADGILIFDVKNVYIDESIDSLAQMIVNTAAKVAVAASPQRSNLNIQELAGRILGQYELKALLGMGGMGAVYRAHQPSLNRDVAVKVLTPALAAEAGYAERFAREAQVAAALEHAHIVPVHDYGQAEGLSYVVMRLLTGGSLADRMASGLVTLAATADIIQKLAGALAYAHKQGVIHRDIKASNVMFDDQGTPFLVDFGIAKLTSATTALTGTGAVMGTPLYMAPEQWRGEGITPETDQYALAVLAYGLMTGHMPFEASTPYALMHQHLNEPPPMPQVWRSDLPAGVSAVLQQALAKEAADRFPSILDFANALTAALESGAEVPVSSPATPPAGSTRHTLHSQPTRVDPEPVTPPPAPARPNWLVSGAIALVIVVLGLIVLAVLGSQPGGFLAASVPTATDAPPTMTDVPPSATDVPPSPTPVPPTAGIVVVATATTAPATATAVPASDTPEPPTDAPTPAPTTLAPATATDVPPTDPPPTDTPIPTDTPEPPTATTPPTNVLLLYDADAFTLHNQSGRTLSLEGVLFRSGNGNWEARDWGVSLHTTLPDNNCLRLRDAAVGNRQPPAICGNLYGLQLVGSTAYFWKDVDQFEVVRSGEVIADCPVAAGECRIFLP